MGAPDDDHRPTPTAPTDLATAPAIATALPGPLASEIIARDEAVTSPSLTRVYPLVVRRARGCVIEDVDGNRFLDFNAGIAVTAAGHAHPAVNAAIHAQVDDVLHYCSSDFYLPAYADLCERLAALAPMQPAKVFLSNSGTEAVEAALKLARHHTGRPNAIAFFGAFHGRSLGSLSLTASKSRQRAGFGIVTPGSFHAPYFDPYDDERRHRGEPTSSRCCSNGSPTPRTSPAIFVEPIQGEGGYIVPPAGLARRPAGAVRCARHHPRRRRGAVGHRPHGHDVGRRSTTASSPTSCASARDWPADCRSPGSSPAARSWTGSPAGTDRRSAATRWPAPPLWPRSISSSPSSPPTPPLSGRTSSPPSDKLAVDAAADRAGPRSRPDGRHRPARSRHRGAVERACFEHGLLVLTCGDRSIRMAPPLVVTIEQADIAVDILADVSRRLR